MIEDIAHAALWLASEDSSFVNGHALVVDGGVIGGMKWWTFGYLPGEYTDYVVVGK